MPVIPQVRRLMFNDEEIGMGFNSESGLAVGTALEGFTVKEDAAASGQEVTASVSIIESHDQLMEQLGMSFEAQGRYGFFSASAKATFAESTQYNSTSTFLVARVIVENPLVRGKGFKVTAEAQRLLSANRSKDFKAAFGDSFVRGLQTGGEFYAVIRITSVSSATQTELAMHLQAEVQALVGEGSFEGKFTEANSKASTRSEYSATMYQKAGTGVKIAPTVEIVEVIERFKQFPVIASDDPAAYETEVATYDTLPLPIPTPEEQEDFLLALVDARDRKLLYLQTRNDLEFARRNPSFFEEMPPEDVLSSAIRRYTQLINAVMDHAIRLSRGELTPPRLFDPSELSPPLEEPAPIALRRVVAVAAPTVRVPSFVGISNADLEQAARSFGHGTIDEIIAGTVGGAQPGDQGFAPVAISREALEVLSTDQVTLKHSRDIVWISEGSPSLTVEAQVPSPGVAVVPGGEVTLLWVESG